MPNLSQVNSVFARLSRRRGFSVIDLVSLLITGLLLLIFLGATVKRSRPCLRLRKCRNKLKNIGLALLQYSDDYRFFPHMAAITEDASQASENSPSDVSTVYRTLHYFKYYDSMEGLICPSSEDFFQTPGDAVIDNPKNFQWGNPNGTGSTPQRPILDKGQDPDVMTNPELSYTYMKRRQSPSSVRSDTMVSADKAVRENFCCGTAGNHTDGFNILFADGHVNADGHVTVGEEIVNYAKTTEDTIMTRMSNRLHMGAFDPQAFAGH